MLRGERRLLPALARDPPSPSCHRGSAGRPRYPVAGVREEPRGTGGLSGSCRMISPRPRPRARRHERPLQRNEERQSVFKGFVIFLSTS